jgi:hypothetical protein
MEHDERDINIEPSASEQSGHGVLCRWRNLDPEPAVSDTKAEVLDQPEIAVDLM